MHKVRFAALMELRRMREDACRRELGKLEMQRQEALRLREAKAEERIRAGQQLHDVAMHELYAQFWKCVEHELQQLDKHIAQIDAAIIKAREAFVEAHRETTIIAKLQERDRLAIARSAAQRERRALDEFAGSRHAASAPSPEGVRS